MIAEKTKDWIVDDKKIKQICLKKFLVCKVLMNFVSRDLLI